MSENTTNTANGAAPTASGNDDLLKARVQREAASKPDPSRPWFAGPLAHNREDEWFRQHEGELIEEAKRRKQ